MDAADAARKHHYHIYPAMKDWRLIQRQNEAPSTKYEHNIEMILDPTRT